jgi:hypothetical protein
MVSRYVLLAVLIALSAFFLSLRGYEAWAQSVESKPDKGATNKSMDASKPPSPKEAVPVGTSSPSVPPGQSHPPSSPSPVPKPLSVVPPVTSSPTAPPPSPKKVEVPFAPKPLSPPPEMSKPVHPPTPK